MALCVIANADDLLEVTLVSPDSCTDYILVDSNEYHLMLQTYEITPLSIAESFGWGFGTIITFWFLGYAIKNARMVIRNV